MHTHWSAKMFPQAHVFPLYETYNLSDLAPLGCAFQEQQQKKKEKERKSETDSLFNPFFLTKSKHGKADSQAEHHRAPHRDWKRRHIWISQQKDKLTIVQPLDKRQGINELSGSKKGITCFHVCHLCILSSYHFAVHGIISTFIAFLESHFTVILSNRQKKNLTMMNFPSVTNKILFKYLTFLPQIVQSSNTHLWMSRKWLSAHEEEAFHTSKNQQNQQRVNNPFVWVQSLCLDVTTSKMLANMTHARERISWLCSVRIFIFLIVFSVFSGA